MGPTNTCCKVRPITAKAGWGIIITSIRGGRVAGAYCSSTRMWLVPLGRFVSSVFYFLLASWSVLLFAVFSWGRNYLILRFPLPRRSVQRFSWPQGWKINKLAVINRDKTRSWYQDALLHHTRTKMVDMACLDRSRSVESGKVWIVQLWQWPVLWGVEHGY